MLYFTVQSEIEKEPDAKAGKDAKSW